MNLMVNKKNLKKNFNWTKNFIVCAICCQQPAFRGLLICPADINHPFNITGYLIGLLECLGTQSITALELKKLIGLLRLDEEENQVFIQHSTKEFLYFMHILIKKFSLAAQSI